MACKLASAEPNVLLCTFLSPFSHGTFKSFELFHACLPTLAVAGGVSRVINPEVRVYFFPALLVPS